LADRDVLRSQERAEACRRELNVAQSERLGAVDEEHAVLHGDSRLFPGATVFNEDGSWSEFQAFPTKRRCSERVEVVCRRNQVAGHAIKRCADIVERAVTVGAVALADTFAGFIEGLSWWAVAKHPKLLGEGFVVVV
jgi:hypothetical protein